MSCFVSAPLARDLENVVWLDVRDEKAYLEGHIPGARRWDPFTWFYNDVASEEKTQLPKKVSRWCQELGITGEENVVVYESGTGMHAARGVWFLRYAGLDASFVLRGGIEAWGQPLSKDVPTIKRGRYLPKFRTDELATTLFVNASLKDKNFVILDTRSKGEHQGGEGSRECCARKGRIPGAVWLEWSELFTEKQADLKSKAELKSLLAAQGVSTNKEIITYCHRGARASAAYLVLKELGYKKVRVYLASWHMWASRPELGVETS